MASYSWQVYLTNSQQYQSHTYLICVRPIYLHQCLQIVTGPLFEASV